MLSTVSSRADKTVHPVAPAGGEFVMVLLKQIVMSSMGFDNNDKAYSAIFNSIDPNKYDYLIKRLKSLIACPQCGAQWNTEHNRCESNCDRRD